MLLKKYHRELLIYAAILILGVVWLAEIEAFERVYDLSREHEDWELDEIALAIPVFALCLAIFSINRMRDARKRAVELERAREELSRTNDRLVEMSRSREEFLTMVSHELRSPLSGIVNSLQLMELAEDEQEWKEGLGYAKSAARGMSVLIDDVLLSSRLAHGESDEEAAIAPAALLDSIRELTRLQADAKGIELLIVLDESVPEAVIGNEAGLRVAILNLVGNAIKYTESGGVTVGCECIRPGPCTELLIKVTDTGVGISAEDQLVIFEPYRQVNGSGAGLGLGLALVSRVVGKMGGTISVSSTVGQGSEFSIRVPVGPA